MDNLLFIFEKLQFGICEEGLCIMANSEEVCDMKE